MLIPAVLMMIPAAMNVSATLEPAGKWSLDQEPSRCFLQRSFSREDKQWNLGILPHPGLPRVDLLIQPDDERHSNAVTITLQPSGVRFDGEVKTAQLPGGRFVSRISVDSEFLNALSPATELIIATRYGEPLAFHLTGSDTATAALKACEGDLLKSWGVDPARFIALIPPGKPGFVDLSQYIGGDDYPRAANGANGEVLALLTIGLDGKITGCRTIESSGNDALDQRTCEIARRIHYSVALDQDKKPVSSWTVFKVHWYFSNS